MIAAEHRERHEHLAGVRDVSPQPRSRCRAAIASSSVELVAPRLEQCGELSEGQRLAGLRPGQRAPARRRGAGNGTRRPSRASLLPLAAMKVVAVAGGIGAGKFLRGLARVVPGEDAHRRHQRRRRHRRARAPRVAPTPTRSPIGSETRSTATAGGAGAPSRSGRPRRCAAFDPSRAWFGLGDLDLGTHLYTDGTARGGCAALGGHRADRRDGSASAPGSCPSPTIPWSRVSDCLDHETGEPLDLHFQEYWVRAAGRRPGHRRALPRGRRRDPGPGGTGRDR